MPEKTPSALAMVPVFLVQVKTRDGIILDGAYVKPRRPSRTAFIWIHGLSSNFSSGQVMMHELSKQCQRNGIGYFKFNTRGHDIIAKSRRPKGLIGAAFEKFRDCRLDIRATIAFAKKLGYRKFILAGHSTGANKALYYLYKTGDRRVRGLVLAGPISDVAAETKHLGPRKLKRAVATAERLSKKNRQSLIPAEYGIWTAERYVSLYRPGSSEDVFPYHNPRARWKELRSVRQALAVVIGSRDEYLDCRARDLVKIFQRHASSTKLFSGIIIKGARHSFIRKEKELAAAIIRWIARAVA